MQRSWWIVLTVSAAMLGLTGARSLAKPPGLPSENHHECLHQDKSARGRFSFELEVTPKGVTVKFGAESKPEPTQAIDAVCPAVVPAYLELLFKQMQSAWTPQTPPTPLSANARAIEQRLNQPISLNFKDVPLRQAIKDLSVQSGLVIVSKVDIDKPVTFAVEDVSMREALQKLLGPLQLTFVIENDALTITPVDARRGARVEEPTENETGRLYEIAEIYRRTGHYGSARFYYQLVHRVAPTSRLGRLAIDRLTEMDERIREAEEASNNEDPQAAYDDMRSRSVPLGLVEGATY